MGQDSGGNIVPHACRLRCNTIDRRYDGDDDQRNNQAIFYGSRTSPVIAKAN
jgi:hypothetical protein